YIFDNATKIPIFVYFIRYGMIAAIQRSFATGHICRIGGQWLRAGTHKWPRNTCFYKVEMIRTVEPPGSGVAFALHHPAKFGCRTFYIVFNFRLPDTDYRHILCSADWAKSVHVEVRDRFV